MTTDYNKLKATELKELLKERGIAAKGLTRKQQYVEALEAHDAENGDESEDAPGDAEVGETEDAPVIAQAGVTNGAHEGGDAPTEAPAGKDVMDMEQKMEGVVEEGTKDVKEVERTAEDIAEAESTTTEAKDMIKQDEEVEDEKAVDLDTKDEAHMDLTVATEEKSSESTPDTRKRKRRSPSPAPTEDSVNKKLKSATEEIVKLPEDEEEVLYDDAPDPAPAGDPIPSAAPAENDAVAVSDPTALHRPTRSLYIRELMRPLQPGQVQDYLTYLATDPADRTADSLVKKFHLDNIRTHAFATFSTTQAAARVRAALHDTIWPSESTRKPLWVDYIPDDKVQEWIETETGSTAGKRDFKRWEVVYSEDGDASLEQITAPVAPGRQPSFSSQGQVQAPGLGMPNAPLGPRSSIARPHGQAPSAPAQSHQRAPTPTGPRSSRPAHPLSPRTSSPRRSSQPEPSHHHAASFTSLDRAFPSTQTAKPKLYYLPVSEELAQKRLDELKRVTARSYDPRRTGPESDLRRYTFEDGDKVVDNGPDFGTAGRGGGGGGGGRRGRGGGWRGGWR